MRHAPDQLQKDLFELHRLSNADVSIGQLLFDWVPSQASFALITPLIQCYLSSPSLAYPGLAVVDELALNYLNVSRSDRKKHTDVLRKVIEKSNINWIVEAYSAPYSVERYVTALKRRCLGGTLTKGVNVIGYFDSSSGLGEDARLVEQALIEAGVNTSRFSLSHIGDRQTKEGLDHQAVRQRLKYKVSIVCISPLEVQSLNALPFNVLDEGHVNIGLLPWELPHWNEPNVLDLFTEIWAISTFCYQAYHQAGYPVQNIGSPVHTDHSIVKATDHTSFNVLSVIDAASRTTRKNPEGALRAFLLAFPKSDYSHCRLTLKVMNADASTKHVLTSLSKGDERIEFVFGNLSSGLMERLYHRADCFMSLARSEGLGRNVAEAVVRCLPVVSTRWSGMTDLLPSDYPWSVGYALVPAQDYPQAEGQQWAEPSLDDAASKLQLIYRASARQRDEICRVAAERLANQRAIAVVGARYKQRLKELGVRC